jgi:hypothetical protein
LFTVEIDELSVFKEGNHVIYTTPGKPVYKRNFRVTAYFESEITAESEKTLRLIIIIPSRSPWCSRIVPVKK